MTTGKFNPAAMYGITRGVHRWKVNLERERLQLFKGFNFAIFGGEEAALIRAQAWRDEMVKAQPPVVRTQRANRLRRDNKTGIPGVSCKLGPDGQPVLWLAQTAVAPGKKLRKGFSVGRHGANAKLLAIAERQKHLQQMTGLARLHPAEERVRSSPVRPIPADCPAPLASAEIVRRSNSSGVSGVYYCRGREGDPGRWVAQTNAAGNILVKSFSIRKYGEENAKELAIAERQRQLAQVRTPAQECVAESGSTSRLSSALEPRQAEVARASWAAL